MPYEDSPGDLIGAVIRPAVYSEIKQIKEVAKSHHDLVHFSFPGYCNMQRFNRGEILVVADDNKIVGFAVCAFRRIITSIDIIGLAELYRNKGIGKQFLDYIKTVKDNDVIELDCNKDNPDALRFYERYGFKQIGDSRKGKSFRMRLKHKGIFF